MRRANVACLLPIHLAAANDHDAIVRAMLAVDDGLLFARDARGRSAIHFAAKAEGGKVLTYLLQQGADPNEVYQGRGDPARSAAAKQKAPANIAAKLSDVRNLTLLQQYGAELDVDDAAHLAPRVSAAKAANRKTHELISDVSPAYAAFDLAAFRNALTVENLQVAGDIIRSASPAQIAVKGAEALVGRGGVWQRGSDV